MSQYTSPNATIGQIVRWWSHGDTNQKPTAAIVVDTDGKGCLSLSLVRKYAADFNSVEGARHVSDPILQSNPNLARSTGAWDFVENQQPVVDPSVPLLNQDSIRQAIYRMADTGMSTSEITSALGRPWRFQDVQAIVDSRPKHEATKA